MKGENSQIRRDKILRKLDTNERDDDTMVTLAAEFEVSRSTAYRDIKFLIEEEGYPIETIRGNGGGVVLRKHKKRYRDNLSLEHNAALARATLTASAADAVTILEIMELFK
jgi:predicted DNA-binding transcriptional regulator YafY